MDLGFAGRQLRQRASMPKWRVIVSCTIYCCAVLSSSLCHAQDAGSLVYVSSVDQIVAVEPRTGEVLFQLPFPRAEQYRMASDGQELFLVTPDGEEVQILDAVTGATKAPRFSVECCLTGEVAASSGRLYVTTKDVDAVQLATYDIRTGITLSRSRLPNSSFGLVVPEPSRGCCGDCDNDGLVQIDEILKAVTNALDGCGGDVSLRRCRRASSREECTHHGGSWVLTSTFLEICQCPTGQKNVPCSHSDECRFGCVGFPSSGQLDCEGLSFFCSEQVPLIGCFCSAGETGIVCD